MGNWWDNGNDLALVQAIRDKTRGDSEAQTKFFSHLIGAARVAGLSDPEIHRIWQSDRWLVIYEP